MKIAVWLSISAFLFITWMSESPMFGFLFGWVVFSILWCILQVFEAFKPRRWI